jgi:oligopeptide/dipeptide ABC transporter ATP-binding protein
MTDALLDVDHLAVEFATDDGVVRAVDGITFSVQPGETLAIVGESGCGKTVTALSIMGLISKPGRVCGGTVRFGDRDLRALPEDDYRRLRGNEIAMIFQDPLSSLNPAFRVGDQIAEAIRVHHPQAKSEARARAVELLALVGIAQAGVRTREYPHQFSGGMRQRAMIAMAIANHPQLLIADEPTTALDVTIQAQVLEVLRAAQAESNAAMILITHDLGVVACVANRVLVMYAGRIVEQGSVDEIFYSPRHPYTIALLGSVPRLDGGDREALPTISGLPPSLIGLPDACALAPRCPFVIDRCRSERPELESIGDATSDHRSACFRADALIELTATRSAT